MADAGRASNDVWHRSLEDLLQAIETGEAGGASQFVINLQTSAVPIAPPSKAFPQFDGLRVYQRRNERSAQFQLRLGIIASDLEADAILAAVRAHYPTATKAAVDEEDRHAIARALDPVRDPVRPVDSLPPAATAPTPSAPEAAPKVAAAPDPEPQSVEDLRWDIDELLPDLCQTFPSGRNPSAPPATPTQAQPAPQMTAQPNVRTPQTAHPVVPRRAVKPQAEPSPPKPAADAATSGTPVPRPPHSSSRIRPPTELRPSLRPTLARAHLARRLDVTATTLPPRTAVPNGHAPHAVSAQPPRATAVPERAIALPPERTVAPPVRTVAPPERAVAAPDRVAASPERAIEPPERAVEPPEREVAPPPERAAAAPERSVVPPRLARVSKDAVKLGASARTAPDRTADSGTLQSVVARIGTLIDAVEARAEGAAAALRAARARTASARTAPARAAPARAAAPLPTASEPTASEQARPAPAPPSAPSSRPAASARAASVELDSTRTVRALTALELTDMEASRWFAIQLMRSAEPIDAEQVPNLDIFSEYRLYSVVEPDGDASMQALRVGFFSSEVAAQAVAGYLSTYFPTPEIKRVSIAEHERFAEQLVVALKDVGAAGTHAVIEVAPAPPPLEVRVEVAPSPVDDDKRSSNDSGSFWSRLKALRAQR